MPSDYARQHGIYLKGTLAWEEEVANMAHMLKGSCLCKAVKFEVSSDLKKSDGCHCIQCRKHSGHYFASTDVPREKLKITGEENIKWYQSSEKVRRGFCGTCGSSLFWDPVQRDWTSIAMGAFDGPTHVKLDKHIFVSEKGDYYELKDGVEQHQR